MSPAVIPPFFRTTGRQDFFNKVADFTTFTEIITDKGFEQEVERLSTNRGMIKDLC